MYKPKKILLLCLSLSMVAFLSCGNLVEPTITNPNDDFSVVSLTFFKGDYRIYNNGKTKLPYVREIYEIINECTVIDNVIINCMVDLSHYYYDWDNIKIIAKATSSKTGDVKRVVLVEDFARTYAGDPNHPIAFIGYLTFSNSIRSGGLKVSPYGDMVTIEIVNSNSKIIKTINII